MIPNEGKFQGLGPSFPYYFHKNPLIRLGMAGVPRTWGPGVKLLGGLLEEVPHLRESHGQNSTQKPMDLGSKEIYPP